MSEHTGKRPGHDAGRRRRPPRPGLIQVIYIVVALALAVILPQLTGGPTVTGSTAQNSLLALAAGMIVLVGLAMGLLFLMVQWAFTTFTPRLTLFRDDTLVWHALGLFLGTIVFALVAACWPARRATYRP